MMKTGTTFGLPALLLGSALGISAFAQTSDTCDADPRPDSTGLNQLHDESERQHDLRNR